MTLNAVIEPPRIRCANCGNLARLSKRQHRFQAMHESKKIDYCVTQLVTQCCQEPFTKSNDN